MHVCLVRDSVENVIWIRVKTVINATAVEDTAKEKIWNRFALAAPTQMIAPHVYLIWNHFFSRFEFKHTHQLAHKSGSANLSEALWIHSSGKIRFRIKTTTIITHASEISVVFDLAHLSFGVFCYLSGKN